MKRFWATPLARVIIKGLALFVILNLAFALLQPMALLGRLSLYNGVFPGRERLPFGYRPDKAYNLVVNNLDAMLASQTLSAPKQADEYRVLVLGDSSVWGVLLQPGDTLTGRLNALGLRAPDGRRMRFYNLGYPDFSVTKDLLLLQRGLDLKPDLMLWLVTLNSLPTDRQIEHLLVRSNPAETRALIARYGLGLNASDGQFDARSLLDRSIVGERRNLADLLRLQVLGAPWAATGIDQDYPERYDPITLDLDASDPIRGLTPPVLRDEEIRLDVLTAGDRLARERGVPLAFVNEPTAISAGKNSDVRYNAFYPRWAYDQYRARLAQTMRAAGAGYLDLWDLAPVAEFTNSPVHLNPAGSARLAQRIAEALPGWVR
jgi:hypothetical protein